jgi:hypothetical protein
MAYNKRRDSFSVICFYYITILLALAYTIICVALLSNLNNYINITGVNNMYMTFIEFVCITCLLPLSLHCALVDCYVTE